MDLTHIQSQLQYMPDQQLAQEVQNPNGAVPSYLALAELNRRNKLRQGAPQQMPQGTVADQVMGSLKSAGVQSQSQQMPMQQVPQGMPMGIAGAAQAAPQQAPQGLGAARMAGGGIVRLAGQGNSQQVGEAQPSGDPDSDIGYDGSDSAPRSQGIAGAVQALQVQGPQAPQIQGQSQSVLNSLAPKYDVPDARYSQPVSIQQAQNDIAPLYGDGPDYPEIENGLRGLRASRHQMTDAQRDEYQYTLGAASDNPNFMSGYFGAKAQAQAAQWAYNQKWYDDQTKSYMDQFDVKKSEQARTQDIVQSIREYQNNLSTQQHLANTSNFNQDEQRAVMMQANNNQIATIAKQIQNPADVIGIGKASGLVLQDPNATPAQKQAAQSTIGWSQDVLKAMNDQAQKTTDMGTNSKIAEENAAGAWRLREVNAAHAAQMAQLGYANRLQNPNAHGEDALAGVDPLTAAHVRAIATYKQPMPTGAALKQFPFLPGLVAQYNPDYTTQNYNGQNKLTSSLDAGTLSERKMSINKVIGHLDELNDGFNALGNSGSTGANTARNFVLRNMTNDKRLGAIDAAANGVSSEMVHAFGDKSVNEVADWRKSFGDNATLGTQKGAIDSSVGLLAKQMAVMKNQIRQVKGDDFANKYHLLDGDTRKTLTKLGYDPDQIENGTFTPHSFTQHSGAPSAAPTTSTTGAATHRFNPATGQIEQVNQ